jgi:hypothetical protein
MLSPSTTAPTGTGTSGTHPQTCTLPASQTSTNLGSIGRYALAFATLATMTSSKRTSGDSAMNRAVYPVGDQLAGTIAVDLSEPEPLWPEPLPCEPPPEPLRLTSIPEPPLPPESLGAKPPLLCCEPLPDRELSGPMLPLPPEPILPLEPALLCWEPLPDLEPLFEPELPDGWPLDGEPLCDCELLLDWELL